MQRILLLELCNNRITHRAMTDLEPGMNYDLFKGCPLLGVNSQQFLHKVNSCREIHRMKDVVD